MKHWPIWMDGLAIESHYKWMGCLSETQLDDLWDWPCVSNTGTSAWKKLYSCIWHVGKWGALSLTSDSEQRQINLRCSLSVMQSQKDICSKGNWKWLVTGEKHFKFAWFSITGSRQFVLYTDGTFKLSWCICMISCCATSCNQLHVHFRWQALYIFCMYIILYTHPNIQPSWQAGFSGSMFHIIGCNLEVPSIDPAQNNHPTHIAQLACKLGPIRCHADASPLLFTEVSLQWTSHAASESDIEIESVWEGEQAISILCLFLFVIHKTGAQRHQWFERMQPKCAFTTNLLLKLNCC